MGFPQKIAEQVLVDCGRCCAICHKFCGSKIELHHIKQAADGGEDIYENCIPLCFDCHADVKAYDPKHPKGKKYTENELREHRDRWYRKILQSPGINQAENIENDMAIFEEINNILSESNVPFLYHYDYHNSFSSAVSDSLNHFSDRCYNPYFEFTDADMEMKKADLLNACNELAWLFIGLTTISVDRKEIIVDNEIQASERVHQATLRTKNCFDEFVRLGRKKYQIKRIK